MIIKKVSFIALLFLTVIIKSWSQQIPRLLNKSLIINFKGDSLEVPMVYGDPAMGKATIKLDFGAPFNKELPTVIVVADGQQFYVQKDAMKALQENTFGNAVNVVGIITRGTTAAFINASLNKQGKPDWFKAWKIFNSDEWIEDIESVRKALIGNNGKVYLYGRSGGAYLVHQYLAKYANHAAKAFTQSSVNPYLNKELGISLDRFWSDLGDQDVNLQTELQKALQENTSDRNGILMTLQRQHFFVPADKIANARATLIHKLADGDTVFYRLARKEYEVDEMTEMAKSKDIIPQDVRVLELISPSGAFDIPDDGGVYPLAETQRNAIRPLIDLQSSGKITLKPFDFAALHRCQTQLFVLAGRYDEAVDYRTNIALASEYPVHELFIANDNHVFSNLSTSGMSQKIIINFYAFGLRTPQLSNTLANAHKYRWTEK
jgi:pimeloyl-ACP methyl ester carboxylesterase